MDAMHSQLQHKKLFIHSSQLPPPLALLNHIYSFTYSLIYSYFYLINIYFTVYLEPSYWNIEILNSFLISWKERCKNITIWQFVEWTYGQTSERIWKTEYLIFAEKGRKTRESMARKTGRPSPSGWFTGLASHRSQQV